MTDPVPEKVRPRRYDPAEAPPDDAGEEPKEEDE